MKTRCPALIASRVVLASVGRSSHAGETEVAQTRAAGGRWRVSQCRRHSKRPRVGSGAGVGMAPRGSCWPCCHSYPQVRINKDDVVLLFLMVMCECVSKFIFSD
ncbi:hypothetical protein E2C01_049592 [Portunus trituberculatus]|uniref:Uncharacterized protein n=1 Tax=Portunus trituberculatus TaxID=210409 RepID=A0A5B7GDJ4_PORTR|nr:hypothetical protein [Portunus trituberculatus]